MSVHGCMRVCTGGAVCVCDQRSTLGTLFSQSPFYFLRQSPWLNLEFASLAGLTGHVAPEILLPQSSLAPTQH